MYNEWRGLVRETIPANLQILIPQLKRGYSQSYLWLHMPTFYLGTRYNVAVWRGSLRQEWRRSKKVKAYCHIFELGGWDLTGDITGAHNINQDFYDTFRSCRPS